MLVVARWPLGGIRTYLLYMLRHFPAAFRVTVLAASTREDAALATTVLFVRRNNRPDQLQLHLSTRKALRSSRFDVVFSQWLKSCVVVYRLGEIIYGDL